MNQARGRALRQFPPLAFVAASAALALLMPSALTLPQTGPSALAEYAPVPGEAQSGESPLSELAAADSEGLGSGGAGPGPGAGAVGEGGPPPPPPHAGGAGVRRAGTKRCVGSPPRQTEDPLSPPCIAFFDGPNFGASAKGITDSEIRVLYVSRCDSANTDKLVDLDNPSDPDYQPALAGLVRHFNERYQLYGRRIHMWWATRRCGDVNSVRAAMRALDEAVDPFAAINYPESENVTSALAELGVMVNLAGASRAFAAARKPYIRSFYPDGDAKVSLAATFVCQHLVGRPARFSGNALDTGRTRQLAVFAKPRPDAQELASKFRRTVADQCGEAAGEIERSSATSEYDAPSDVARWQSKGVTTVVAFEIPLLHLGTAESAKWYPEWFYVEGGGSNYAGRLLPPTQWRNAFGLWSTRREPLRREEAHWYRATQDGCGGCAVEGRPYDYNELLLFGWGIQAAGPRLTPGHFVEGLTKLPNRASSDPFLPAAYFGNNDFSFVKDAALVRWDSSGVVPGQSPGCYRLPQHGLRYRVEDWHRHPGDGVFDLSTNDWPCQGG